MQGAVGFLNSHLTTNLPMNLAVKKISVGKDLTELRSRVCGPIFGPPCITTKVSHGRRHAVVPPAALTREVFKSNIQLIGVGRSVTAKG